MGDKLLLYFATIFFQNRLYGERKLSMTVEQFSSHYRKLLLDCDFYT